MVIVRELWNGRQTDNCQEASDLKVCNLRWSGDFNARLSISSNRTWLYRFRSLSTRDAAESNNFDVANGFSSMHFFRFWQNLRKEPNNTWAASENPSRRSSSPTQLAIAPWAKSTVIDWIDPAIEVDFDYEWKQLCHLNDRY